MSSGDVWFGAIASLLIPSLPQAVYRGVCRGKQGQLKVFAYVTLPGVAG